MVIPAAPDSAVGREHERPKLDIAQEAISIFEQPMRLIEGRLG